MIIEKIIGKKMGKKGKRQQRTVIRSIKGACNGDEAMPGNRFTSFNSFISSFLGCPLFF